MTCRCVRENGTVYRYERRGVLHGLTRVRGSPKTMRISSAVPTKSAMKFGVPSISLSTFARNGAKRFQSLSLHHARKICREPADWERATEALVTPSKRGTALTIWTKAAVPFTDRKSTLKGQRMPSGGQWALSTIQFDFNCPDASDLTFIGKTGSRIVPTWYIGPVAAWTVLRVPHRALRPEPFPLWFRPFKAVVIPITDQTSRLRLTKVQRRVWKIIRVARRIWATGKGPVGTPKFRERAKGEKFPLYARVLVRGHKKRGETGEHLSLGGMAPWGGETPRGHWRLGEI